MHFYAEINVVLGEEVGLFCPVGDGDGVPLIFKDVAEFIRPGTGDPVRIDSAGAVSWASAEPIEAGEVEGVGELDAFAESVVVVFSEVFIGVEGVSVDGDCAEDESASAEFGVEIIARFFAFKEFVDVEMRVSGVGTGTEFDGLDSEALANIENFGEGFIAEEGGEKSDFHIFESEMFLPKMGEA